MTKEQLAEPARFAPKCIWCSAKWSDSNLRVYDFDAADHCESGRFSPETVTVSIVCHACNREMYRKEGDSKCLTSSPPLDTEVSKNG